MIGVNSFVLMDMHRILMAISWFVLIPWAIWMSTVGRSTHPEHWKCYHGSLMMLATILTVSAVTIAYLVVGAPFVFWHQVLGLITVTVLLIQATVGSLIYWKPSTCANVKKLHQIFGMLIYIAGLITGAFGVYDYSQMLLNEHVKYFLAMALGFVLAVNAYVLWHAVPLWYSHVSGNRQQNIDYERLVPELP